MSLYGVLKNAKNPTELKKYGYDYDSQLSTKNNQVYYNPTSRKLLYIARPTDPSKLADLRTYRF